MTIRVALRTVSLESRRGGEMARLLERHGMQPIEAPSLREVPLADQTEALAFGEALMRGECDLLVLLTGVGTRALVAALSTRWPAEDVVRALSTTRIACRGPKPVVALKELGLKPALLAPEPNTWRELMGALAAIDLTGQRVWIQEYGKPNPQLEAALRERGAELRSAAVYAWQLPEDLAPLRGAIDALCDHAADAVVFTSARQIDHVLEIAQQMGREAELRSVLASDVLVASIGPVTTEALAGHGIGVDLVPAHPKMGHLVKTLVADGVRLLDQKRAARSAE